MMRATMSPLPPGGNPTTQRSGCDGQACAVATRDTAGAATPAAAKRKNPRREGFMRLFRRDRHALAQPRHDVALEQLERTQRFRQRQVAEREAANQIVRAGFRKLP